jgi:hypothetical protein
MRKILLLQSLLYAALSRKVQSQSLMLMSITISLMACNQALFLSLQLPASVASYENVRATFAFKITQLTCEPIAKREPYPQLLRANFFQSFIIEVCLASNFLAF